MTTIQDVLHRCKTLEDEQVVWYWMGIINPLKDWWQIDDMLQFLLLKEVVWIRSRGGSKTGDAVEFAILLGLRYGNGAWYSSQSGQLDEAKDRFKLYQPWVQNVNQHRVLLIDGTVIYLGNYGGRMNTRGRRPRWIISDEEGEIDVNSKMNASYEGAIGSSSIKQTIERGRVIDLPQAMKLHMGTPKLNSVLQRNSQTYPTFVRDIPFCHWIDVQQYQHMPAYWQDRELHCKFTAATGAAFPIAEAGDKSGVVSTVKKCDFPVNFDRITQGIDPNGQHVHNCGIRLGWLGQDKYVLEEQTFQFHSGDHALQQWCAVFPSEIESGGEFNTYFAPNLNGVTKWSWSNGTAKEELIAELNKGLIYIDPEKTPKLYADICAACYTQVGNREVVKVNDLHYLAAMLHGCHVFEWKVKNL